MSVRPRIGWPTSLLALLTLLALVGCVESNRPSDSECAAAEVTLSLSVSTSMAPDDPAVCRGQRVTLTIASSVDGLLHVHGYDEELPVVALADGEMTEVAFVASRSGQFPVELHSDDEPQGASLGVLTVHEP